VLAVVGACEVTFSGATLGGDARGQRVLLVLTLKCKCGVWGLGANRVTGSCDGRLVGFRAYEATSFRLSEALKKIELKSLILAQIERWRHALHMQVERAVGATWQSVADG
jgi:hypothetical protein